MFDPYGAERHGQRTRQQRKAAPRGQALRALGMRPRAVPFAAAIQPAGTGSRCGGPFRPAGTVPRVISLSC